MRFDPRYLAVAACGWSAFLTMYATQPLLPLLRAQFGVGEAAVGATISSLTLGCALSAPFVGPLADAVGRKRVIVSAIAGLVAMTFAASRATTLHELVLWRFGQGLFMPAIFAVTVAYIAEEFPPGYGGRAIGAYVTGNVVGGFLGRYLGAIVASRAGWQNAFVVLGALTLAGGAIVQLALPRARRFRRQRSIVATVRAMAGFLRDPRMLTSYAIGVSILFSLIAAFTFVTFYLAGPPFGLGTAALGNVFFVYLLGVVASPLAGRSIDRFGHRLTVLVALGVSAAGMLLTLLPTLPTVIAGLALMSSGVFACQGASQGYVGVVARERRSTAASLYLTLYYAGGGFGATLPAPLWTHAGWPGTVGAIVTIQAATAIVVAMGWSRATTKTA